MHTAAESSSDCVVCVCEGMCASFLCDLPTILPLPWLIWHRFPLICYNTHLHTRTRTHTPALSHTRTRIETDRRAHFHRPRARMNSHSDRHSLARRHIGTHTHTLTFTHTLSLTHTDSRVFLLLSISSSLPMRRRRAESWTGEERHAGAYLPGCGLQAAYQDRLQLWGRELANQHSGALLVSSSADHSEAEPRRGENKSAMFSYTNHRAGGKHVCQSHRLSAAFRELFLDSGRPRAAVFLHVFNIDCCQMCFHFPHCH